MPFTSVRYPVRVFTLSLLAATSIAALAACGDNDDRVTDPGQPPAQIAVSMRDNFFRQRVDTVAVNGTVSWSNDGGVPHTTTADAGTWDSGSVSSGGTFQRQFTQAGTFAYHCTFHGSPGSGMFGTVIVR